MTKYNLYKILINYFWLTNWDLPLRSSKDYENFANSRLYTNQPLFDTPPADYVSPAQLVLLQNQGVSKPNPSSVYHPTPTTVSKPTPSSVTQPNPSGKWVYVQQ